MRGGKVRSEHEGRVRAGKHGDEARGHGKYGVAMDRLVELGLYEADASGRRVHQGWGFPVERAPEGEGRGSKPKVWCPTARSISWPWTKNPFR